MVDTCIDNLMLNQGLVPAAVYANKAVLLGLILVSCRDALLVSG